MQILFDKGHPKSLLEALQKVQELDNSETHELSYYDSATEDTQLTKPAILWLVRQKRKEDMRVRILHQQGFRVFAIKRPAKKSFSAYELSVSILGMWPKMLEVMKAESQKFIYTCHCSTRALKKVRTE